MRHAHLGAIVRHMSEFGRPSGVLATTLGSDPFVALGTDDEVHEGCEQRQSRAAWTLFLNARIAPQTRALKPAGAADEISQGWRERQSHVRDQLAGS
jgi:hypothetical protein